MVGYLSGHNESTFFWYILDGMYALDCEEKRLKSQAKQARQTKSSMPNSQAHRDHKV